MRRLGLAVLLAIVAIGAGNAYIIATTRDAIVADVGLAPAREHVLVLGSFVTRGGRPAPELVNRLEIGRALHAAGRARRIIVSGLVRGPYDEPHAMAAWLVAHGVPPADIIIDVRGRRTAASMASAAEMGLREALISTQAYHLPRALYLARRAGIDAVGVQAVMGRDAFWTRLRVHAREAMARAEILLEVALRGVRT